MRALGEFPSDHNAARVDSAKRRLRL